VPVAHSAHDIELEVLAVPDAVSGLGSEDHLRDECAQRVLPQFVKGETLGCRDAGPKEIDGQHEAVLACHNVSGQPTVEVGQNVGARDMDAGVMAEYPDRTVYPRDEDVGRDVQVPRVIVGRRCSVRWRGRGLRVSWLSRDRRLRGSLSK